ncbi:uncharacterized protein LOC128262155 [Drosophila gunungcola]|uniref:uncharacterized protein LOC128262155 n=1 Tax=Drosophila gunungcola TaxID=103775 RepID=UPI0022E70EFB|nr:uncharacterized protein LOC128262155 [Drosophila gunungcola]
MRTSCVIFVVLLCFSLGSAKLFDDELRELTEFLRLQLRCGYPARGVPILAPAQISYKDINIRTENFGCNGNFTELIIEGLDGYEFSKLVWSNIFHTIKFDINFPKISLKSSNYKLNILARLFGGDFSLWGDGVFNLELVNFRANGSFILRPKSATSGVHVKSWKVDWELEEAKSQITGVMNSRLYSKFINDLVKEYLEVMINGSPTEVSQFMEELIVPPMNLVLDNIAWYEITAIIMGLANGILPVEPIC